jgi:hypothetical protein
VSVNAPQIDLVAPPFRYPMAERCIVATAMSKPELAKLTWEQGLRPCEFFDVEPRRAWELIGKTLEVGEMPTLLAVSEWCLEDGLFVAILAEMAEEIDHYNFEANIKKVRAARASWNLLYRLEVDRIRWQSSKAWPEIILSELTSLIETHSSHPRGSSWKETNPNLFETGATLSTEDAPTDFEFYPLAPCGCVSDLAGDPKLAGKTTLVLFAIRAKLNGEKFLDRHTKKGPVVYLTEQSRASFRASCCKAGVAGHQDLHILYYSKCRKLTWPEIAELAIQKCREVSATLMAVDTINQFAGLTGDSENNAGDALTAIAPLQAATAEGIAVVTLSHDRKSGGEVGKSRRGSSAFTGAADSCFSLRRMEGQGRATMRRVLYAGRFDDISGETVIELTETGFTSHGDGAGIAESEARRKILECAPNSENEAVDTTTLLQMASVKPGGTASRAIENILAAPAAELQRIGRGHRGDPYRYYRNSILSNGSSIGGKKETATGDLAVSVSIDTGMERQAEPTDRPSDEILL